MIQAAAPQDSALRRMLSEQPGVVLAVESADTLRWDQDGWRREVLVGDSGCELRGILEIVDNNPMVCADRVAVPSPGATLALIALAPLARAGLLLEMPVVTLAFEGDARDLEPLLGDFGWSGGVLVHSEPQVTGTALLAVALAEVETPTDLGWLDGLYEESYGRSFYVRPTEDWDPALVEGRPYALYQLRVTPDSPRSLLTVRVMADRDGKCGAAQVMHAMNVMAGFEEDLGIPDRFSGDQPT